MQLFHTDPVLYISSISTGFIEIPGQISLNIYASGCYKRCISCHNKSLWEFRTLHVLNRDNYISILKHHPMASWVCFLGGDAVYQPKGLDLIAELSKKAGKRVCLYTGCYFLELSGLYKDNIDLIIDGPYIETKGPINLEETNQKCYINEKGIWRVISFNSLKEYLWDIEQHRDLMKDS